MRGRAVGAKVAAGGADQDAVVDPAVQPHADAEQLAGARTQEGAVLHKHLQALRRARHLQAERGSEREREGGRAGGREESESDWIRHCSTSSANPE